MPTRTRSLLLGAALVAGTAGMAVGCSSSSDSASTTTTTASTTTTTAKDKSFAVDTPEGQVSLSLDGKLPPNWPSDFPVPSGATPAGSGSVGGTEKGVLAAVYTTSQKAEDAFNFYKSDSSLNLSNTSSAGVGNAFVGKGTMSGAYDGSVTVVGRTDSTYIVVVLKTSGTTGGSTPGSTPGTAKGTTAG